eukprot:GHVP01011852.1.p1 GENE.GHVP01011852.1~~GHVP01011852.1.p1  ORF type:complete len:488 (+),score=91.06 GHVP01011852.1:36-1466(+)
MEEKLFGVVALFVRSMKKEHSFPLDDVACHAKISKNLDRTTIYQTLISKKLVNIVPAKTKNHNKFFWEKFTAGLIVISIMGFCQLSRPKAAFPNNDKDSRLNPHATPFVPQGKPENQEKFVSDSKLNYCKEDYPAGYYKDQFLPQYLPKFHKDSLMEKIRKRFLFFTYLHESKENQDLFSKLAIENKFLEANWELHFTNDSYEDIYRKDIKTDICKEGLMSIQPGIERFKTQFSVEGFLCIVDWYYGYDPNKIKVQVSIPPEFNDYNEDIEKWLKMEDFTEVLRQRVIEVLGPSFKYKFPRIIFKGEEVQEQEKSFGGFKDSDPNYETFTSNLGCPKMIWIQENHLPNICWFKGTLNGGKEHHYFYLDNSVFLLKIEEGNPLKLEIWNPMDFYKVLAKNRCSFKMEFWFSKPNNSDGFDINHQSFKRCLLNAKFRKKKESLVEPEQFVDDSDNFLTSFHSEKPNQSNLEDSYECRW